MTQEQRARKRAENQKAFYAEKQAKARTERELALAVIEYARAVAAEQAAGEPNHPVWRELAQAALTWTRRYTQ